MRSLFLLIAMVLALPAHGQVRDVVSGLYAPTLDNYIKNSDCFANTRDITVTGSGTITRTTSTPLRGVASCSIDSNVLGDDIIFATRTFDRNMYGKDCEASFDYTGDASSYNFYPVQNSVALAPAQTLANAGTNSFQGRVFFPCGDGTHATTLVFEANAGGAPAVKIGNVKMGVMQAGNVSQAQVFGSIKFSTDCTGSTASGTFADLTDATCTKTVSGSILAASSNRIGASLPAGSPAGRYVFQMVFPAGLNVAATSQTGFFALNYNGTRFSDILYRQLTANDSYDGLTLLGEITETSPLTSAKDVYLQGRIGSASDVSYNAFGDAEGYLIVTYFPPVSQVISTRCNSNPALCENEFTAYITAAGVVSQENVDWIDGNCSAGGTSNTCTFKTGIFTVAPNCTFGKAGVGEQAYNSISSTGFGISFWNSAGSGGAKTDTMVQCSKQGADYGVNRTIIGTFQEVPRYTNIAKPKTIRYAFGGTSATLASPTNCGASPCVEVYDSAAAVSPPTRSGTGQYASVTIANGTFKNSSPIHCWCKAFETANTARDCAVEIGTDSWSTNANGGYVANINTTTPSGTNRDAYVMLTCEGEAP